MQALTPTFVFQLEKRMRAIQEDEYARSLLSPNSWWPRACKTLNIDGASERLTWFLNTADIKPVGDGGNIPFAPLMTASTELVPQRYASAISVKKDQLLDLRGGGLDILAEWSRQIGAKMSYFPQRLLSELILNGAATDGSANAYDGVPFFADNTTSNAFNGTTVKGHPYNPYNPGLGGYVNWLHGSTATVTQPNGSTYTYPGALPIDISVSVDTAFQNLGRAIAFVGGIKMPDGITPRFLKPRALIVPPALVPRAAELMDAKFIAQAAGTNGGGGADISAVIQRWGLEGGPIEAQEFAATTSYTAQILQAAQSATAQASGVKTVYQPTITGSDTSWYLLMEQNISSTLGGLIHIIREPFKVNYFYGEAASGATGIDAILNRALEIEYHCQGRLSMQYGHPYAIVRVDGS